MVVVHMVMSNHAILRVALGDLKAITIFFGANEVSYESRIRKSNKSRDLID